MATSTQTPVHASRASLAHDVLGDAYMFRYIASFQQGFPQDIVALARENDTTFRPCGWLPALVIASGDLRMLQRLYRLYTDQQAVYNDQSMLSFGSVWLDALKTGQIEIAEWVLAHESIRSDHEPAVALRFAIASKSVKAVEWLLQSGPGFQTAFTPEAIQDCPTLEMFQWLETNVKVLPSMTQLVDCAADHGRLELVQYVFSQYGARCTSRAVVGAATNGHLDVVRFLHENAHEQCSCNAMRAAAWHGHEAVVRYLNEHCSEAHGDAFELAALSGHLSIVIYLSKTRTDVRVMRAHALVAQSGRHSGVKTYLSAMLNPATHCNALRETSSDACQPKDRCSLL